MNSQNASLLLSTIDQTIRDIDGMCGRDPLADTYFARFLVVYICGIYEEIIETIIIDFTAKYSTRREIVTHVTGNMERLFRNPDSQKILDLIKTLNPTWYATLKTMNAERLALDSIVSNKNLIAHGQNSIITLSEVKSYYLDSRPFIETIDRLMI